MEHPIAHFQNCHALLNPLKRHDQILVEVVKLAVGLKIRIDLPFDITKLDGMKFETCTDDTGIKGLKIFQNKDPRNNVRSVSDMLQSLENQSSNQRINIELWRYKISIYNRSPKRNLMKMEEKWIGKTVLVFITNPFSQCSKMNSRWISKINLDKLITLCYCF